MHLNLSKQKQDLILLVSKRISNKLNQKCLNQQQMNKITDFILNNQMNFNQVQLLEKSLIEDLQKQIQKQSLHLNLNDLYKNNDFTQHTQRNMRQKNETSSQVSSSSTTRSWYQGQNQKEWKRIQDFEISQFNEQIQEKKQKIQTNKLLMKQSLQQQKQEKQKQKDLYEIQKQNQHQQIIQKLNNYDQLEQQINQEKKQMVNENFRVINELGIEKLNRLKQFNKQEKQQDKFMMQNIKKDIKVQELLGQQLKKNQKELMIKQAKESLLDREVKIKFQQQDEEETKRIFNQYIKKLENEEHQYQEIKKKEKETIKQVMQEQSSEHKEILKKLRQEEQDLFNMQMSQYEEAQQTLQKERAQQKKIQIEMLLKNQQCQLGLKNQMREQDRINDQKHGIFLQKANFQKQEYDDYLIQEQDNKNLYKQILLENQQIIKHQIAMKQKERQQQPINMTQQELIWNKKILKQFYDRSQSGEIGDQIIRCTGPK